MMMHKMDVPSLVRQMQLNMMLPSMVPLGLPATGVSGRNINGDIIHPDLIRATLGQPLGHSSQPLPGASLQNIPTPQQSDATPGQLVGLPIQSPQGIASSSHGMTSEQVVPAERRQSRRQRRRDSRSSRSRSHRRRSSRHHRRHRDSRRGGGSNSDSELDVDSIRLPATHYLTRDFAKTDNIPSACLMIRKLPRAPRPYFLSRIFHILSFTL